MFSLLMFLHLATYKFIECSKIESLVNLALLEKLKYDGEGIPDLVYCKVKEK